MKRSPKFLFDECVPPPAVKALMGMLGTVPEYDLAINKFGQGSKDDQWLPQLRDEKCWIVVTGDGGRQPKSHERKLPDLCLEYRITHIVFSGKAHDLTWVDKAGILKRLWPQIAETAQAARGTRFILRFHPHREPLPDHVILERKDLSRRKRKKSRPKKRR